MVDDAVAIFEEYRGNLGLSGQPGVGDAFFRWLWDNQGNPDLCQRVRITPHRTRVFEEFPDDKELKRFDRNDRKFVAVAIASGERPPILNASDTDWWNHRDPLRSHGIYVDFLCPELMSRTEKR